MEIKDWNIILASAKCDFVSQGYFNQKLKVTSEVSRIGNSSFTIVHQIVDEEDGTLIAVGEASAVYFNFKDQKSEKIPESFRAELEKHMVKETA